MLLPAKIPFFLPYIYPRRIWSMPSSEKILYLTFDDGPNPVVTVELLDLLKKHKALASFFCIGDRVNTYPALYQRIIDEGHTVGNHTQHHLNGRNSSLADYIREIKTAAQSISSTLFRPPYGRLRLKQANALHKMGMKTVMWTVLSGDYDQTISKEACAKRVLRHISPGNIYLFHDAEKASVRMLYAVERLLNAGTEAGYAFKALPTTFA